MRLTAPFLLVTLLLSASPTLAQDDKVVVATENLQALRAKKPKLQGWNLGLKLSASGAFLQNTNFVGQTEGVTLQFGGQIAGKADLVHDQHEWRNSLSIEHAQLKSPNIERFVKSADALELKSLYLYRFKDMDWLGPFARFRGFTQIFPGELVRAQNVVVRAIDADGNESTTLLPAQTPLPLTAPFEPLILEQSAGLFVEPIDEPVLTVDARLGLGAQEVFSQGGFAAADNADTPELEVRELVTVVSAGVEAEVSAKGTFVPDVLSWNATVGSYYPVLISDDRGLDAVELIHLGLAGGISLKLTQYLSVEYGLKIIRQPFVLNDFQFQNSLLISTAFDLVRPRKAGS